jgi:Uma2 family endonuclease
MTVEQYLTLERSLETRNEFWDGEVVSSSGQGARHSKVVSNLGCYLHQQLRGSPSEVYFRMRVRTPDRRFFLYPDVVVAGTPPEFEDAETDTLLNPALVVQVTSPSVEEYDRGMKSALYRSLASVMELVVVAQDRPYIEHWLRQGTDRWLMIEFKGLEQLLELPAIGCQILLGDIYERVFE